MTANRTTTNNSIKLTSRGVKRLQSNYVNSGKKCNQFGDSIRQQTARPSRVHLRDTRRTRYKPADRGLHDEAHRSLTPGVKFVAQIGVQIAVVRIADQLAADLFNTFFNTELDFNLNSNCNFNFHSHFHSKCTILNWNCNCNSCRS